MNIKYYTVDKNTVLSELMVHDIADALLHLVDKATIVKIDEYSGTTSEKTKMIKDVCRAYDNYSEDFVICIEACASDKEFLPGYIPITYHTVVPPTDRIPVPSYEEVMERERKMLTSLGFTGINEIVGYQYTDAMIYLGGLGKKLVESCTGK